MIATVFISIVILRRSPGNQESWFRIHKRHSQANVMTFTGKYFLESTTLGINKFFPEKGCTSFHLVL